MIFKNFVAWLLSAFRGVCGLALSEFRGSLKKSRSHTHKYATLDFFGATHEIHLKSCALAAFVWCVSLRANLQNLADNAQKIPRLVKFIAFKFDIFTQNSIWHLVYLLPCLLSFGARHCEILQSKIVAIHKNSANCRAKLSSQIQIWLFGAPYPCSVVSPLYSVFGDA